MGWNGALTQNSALGDSITFTPDTSTTGEYTVSSFTAPRKGVYRFQLMGSGGAIGEKINHNAYAQRAGGIGGLTDGYLLLEKGQTVFVGAGGPCSAAFVSSVTGGKLSEIAKDDLHFVAGGGGQGGAYGESLNNTGWNCKASQGGNGGGESGAASSDGGKGGTQSAGGAAGGSDVRHEGAAGAYGTGGAGAYANWMEYTAAGGRGGDGLYGGGGGHAYTHMSVDPNFTQKSARGWGGGGGSGYVKTETLTVRDNTYTSTTSQSGGAESNTNGSVKVTYHARAELPVRFDGAMIERLFFNGTEVGSLVFNGVKLFMRRWTRCLQ